MSWATDLARIAEKTSESLGALAQGVKIAAFSEVVQNTRVDTGRAKGNWNVQENSPDRSTTERTDPSGSTVLAAVRKGATEDGLTYFTNNLPYAEVLEKKDAMVGRAVRLIRNNVSRAASKRG